MIKIEVTGNSIPEVADKLLAIGASLQGITTTMPVEVAKAAPVDPTLNRPTSDASATSPDTSKGTYYPTPKSVPAAEATDSQPTTAEPSSTPAPAALDFDRDVAPHVLALVTRSGKPAAQEILSQFGVEKASLLDPARWPELVAALQDAG
jgi:cytoskeletal protein RodZ